MTGLRRILKSSTSEYPGVLGEDDKDGGDVMQRPALWYWVHLASYSDCSKTFSRCKGNRSKRILKLYDSGKIAGILLTSLVLFIWDSLTRRPVEVKWKWSDSFEFGFGNYRYLTSEWITEIRWLLEIQKCSDYLRNFIANWEDTNWYQNTKKLFKLPAQWCTESQTLVSPLLISSTNNKLFAP